VFSYFSIKDILRLFVWVGSFHEVKYFGASMMETDRSLCWKSYTYKVGNVCEMLICILR
jgi:hypothetical protein